MKEKRDNGKFLYIAITLVVVMIVGLYIDSTSDSSVLYGPGKSVYSVDVATTADNEDNDPDTQSGNDGQDDDFHIQVPDDDNIYNSPEPSDDEPAKTADNSGSEKGDANNTGTKQPAKTKSPLTLSKTDTVYITASGSKFHIKNDCGNMNPNNAKSLTVAEALAKGKEACKRCLKNVKIS